MSEQQTELSKVDHGDLPVVDTGVDTTGGAGSGVDIEDVWGSPQVR